MDLPSRGDGPAYRFNTDLEIRKRIGARTWTLLRSLAFTFPLPVVPDPEPGGSWIGVSVPAGVSVDLASAPSWAPRSAAVVHSWIYGARDHNGFTRSQADALLRGLAVAEGMTAWGAFALWLAVRIFSRAAWRHGTARGRLTLERA